jgi:Recombinase zinc beta ribbon domain
MAAKLLCCFESAKRSPTPPQWSALPSERRRRVCVLIGQLAMRKLNQSASRSKAETEHEQPVAAEGRHSYVYGRRHTGALTPGSGRRRVETDRRLETWQVLLKERWPAYISWETYEENQRQLAANQNKHKGVPRGGPSLLSGLLVCGRCGYRMATCYRTNGRDLRYNCTRAQVNKGQSACQSLSGGVLDSLIGQLVLAVLQPSAIEVSLQLAEDVELERTQRHRQWALRLKQARFEVERAERQYNAVEPENRLVARTLERRWEEALAAETKLQDEHARFLAREPAHLTASEQGAIRRLAEDVPALWHAPTTTPAERKEIVRLLLERVVVTVEGSSENIIVECRWAGGVQTEHKIVRPVRYIEQLSKHRQLVARIKALHQDGVWPAAIARTLNAEAWRLPHGGPVPQACLAGSRRIHSPERVPQEVELPFRYPADSCHLLVDRNPARHRPH